MATKGKHYITFRDINSGKLPDGTYDREIVELVAKSNPVLDDVLWKECNHGNENVSTIRTGLPETSWRAFYQGIQGSKGSKKQVANSCGRFSTAIMVDADLYEGSLDKAQFLLDEAEGSAASMGNFAAEALFYGDIKDDPRGLNGLAKVYSVVGGINNDADEVPFYVFDALRASNGSTATLRSIYYVGWGKNTIHGLYPQGSVMGLNRGKFDFHYVDDGTGKQLRMGIQEMNWKMGVNVEDFRYGSRIANIEVDAILAGTAGVKDIIELLHQQDSSVKTDGVKMGYYMDRLTWRAICTVLYRKTQGNAIKYGDTLQNEPDTLFGRPVRKCDALNVNEQRVLPAA